MSKILPIGGPESDPPGIHEISRRAGWDMIRRAREFAGGAEMAMLAGGPKWMTMRFHTEAVKRLLKQKGAKTFAVHKAMYADGTETLVLEAEDANGHPLKGPGVFMLNAGSPCPPTCPTDPPDPPTEP